MDAFEYRGVFWTLDDPGNEQPGVVSFSSQRGIQLVLAGHFGEAPVHWMHQLTMDLNSYSVIHGVVEGNRFVSLLSAYAAGLTMGAPAQERIRGRVMVLGAHCKELRTQKFRDLSVETELLQTWAEIRTLHPKFAVAEGRWVRAEVSYVAPPDIVGEHDGAKYLLHTGFRTSGDGTESFRITTNTSFTVRPPKYQTLEFLLADPLMAVQQLVALATDHPVNVRRCTASLRVSKEDGGWELRSVEVFLQPRLVRTKEDDRQPRPREFLFRRTDLGDLAVALHKWRNARDELDSMFGLIFSERYGDGMLLDQRFVYLVNALETYHRRRIGGEQVPQKEHAERIKSVVAGAPQEHRQWLKNRLRYSNEPALRHRLKVLLRYFPRTADDLIPSQDRFVQKLLVTRNYFVHHDVRLQEQAARGELLYLLTQVLHVFCAGLLMAELGFSTTEIDERLRKRRNHDWLTERLKEQFQTKRRKAASDP